VPDVYQGTELWDLSLVDPDNRRPVDFARRRELLAGLDAAGAQDRRALLAELMESWRDGRVKLYVTATALRLRREQRHVYEAGPYIALEATGAQAQRVLAFGRAHDGAWIVTVVPRLSSGVDDWGDTFLTLPAGAPGVWSDALSSATHQVEAGRLRVADLFRDLPVALLKGTAS
jgi:(1->4)-alpha-D-glucan 1-alpha-D-glucosylmutase